MAMRAPSSPWPSRRTTARCIPGEADHRVLVWDLTGRHWLADRVVDGDRHAVLAATAVASPDGDAVAYADWSAAGPEWRLLDVATGLSTAVPADRIDTPLASWRPDDESVIVADHRQLWVLERRTGRVVEHVVVDADITALLTAPDGAFAAIGNARGEVIRIDAATLEPDGRQVSLGPAITALAALPDGRVVAFLDDMTYAVVDLGDDAVQQRGEL